MTAAPEWQTRVGDVWAAEWRRTDRSFADLARHLDAAILTVAPEHGRAVDLGCGAGATSLALAEARPGLAIHGVDLSAALVEVARQRAARHALENLSFAAGAVPGALSSHEPFDLAVSRHGVMFFDDPATAFAGIAAALRPAAPLVFSCFRSPRENPWASETIASVGGRLDPPAGYAPGPFALADRAVIERLLGDAGFADVSIVPADYTYHAGAGADPAADAADFFRHIGPVSKIVAAASDADRPALLDRLRDVLAAQVTGDVVDFPAAAWLVTARAQGRGQ
ncbi:class I SAM-dependent methyltransferase [Sphingomonas radiodurans]|uniref:class I SAM-dependent methyltransferase n=1 Tax=Sphingomonas radiodurans TaxID=2890321 RepID=UPI001E607043|nr:class I SAM-dependent methyltransferase [Sphingomonas radiodurans]WBH15906.1 class I SAM-dependent methyltransferase [Sphingomonas radiodurans]